MPPAPWLRQAILPEVVPECHKNRREPTEELPFNLK